MRLYLAKGRKLQGTYEVQGLPISVENKKGSKREWYDEFNDEHGTTKMLHDYGYIRGTLGTDDDAVDVFVGPNKHSLKVFVITQAKAPKFTEVDEQKCMLGFDSAKDAKEAYLKHYNNPKFFISMKEMSIDEFSTKLEKQKGKLIKGMPDLEKALSAAIAAFMRKEVEHKAKIAHEQPSIGSNAQFTDNEPPPVPIRRNPFFPPVVSVRPTKE